MMMEDAMMVCFAMHSFQFCFFFCLFVCFFNQERGTKLTMKRRRE